MSSSDVHQDDEILHSGGEEEDRDQHPDSEEESGGEQDPEFEEEDSEQGDDPAQGDDNTPGRWEGSSVSSEAINWLYTSR